jgi:ABC-type spermidine/putrescine transport system permease subunit I
VPESLLEAAADLGARRWRTLRDVVLPLVVPGLAAALSMVPVAIMAVYLLVAKRLGAFEAL